MIIAVDETNPEKSDAIISNLNLDEQPSSPAHRISGRSYGRNGLQSSPIDKELGYIIVTPEELKRLQNVDGITVEEPRHITYPSSHSEENYDSSRYPQSEPPRPSYQQSDSNEYYNSPGERNKYPKRPAPPLSSLSSPNNSLVGYGPSKDPYYDSPPPNHYSTYGSEESGASGAAYGNSPIPESPYGNPPEHAHQYENPAPTGYAPNPSPYESYPAEKDSDPHYRPMYSGYKPPPTSSYDSKYETDTPYSSGPKPEYDYYSNPQAPNGYTDGKHIPPSKPYSSPYDTKFVEPPYRSIGKPLTDTSDGSQNHHYEGNSSPMSYDTSYQDPSLPNSYGSRTKYSSPGSPYTGAHSSPHTNSNFGPEQYSSKDSPYASKPSYTGSYNSEPYKSNRPLYDHSEKYPYKSPKSSYSSPGTYSYGDSPSYGSSKENLPQSYRSPSLTTSYDSIKYPEKPYSASYGQGSKHDSYDPATYEMYGSKIFPSKYKSLSNTDERTYGSSPSSPKIRSPYKTSEKPDIPVVTRFYETPTQKQTGYHFKYPESPKPSPLEKPRYYDSPKPLTVSKTTHLETPHSYSSPVKTEPTKKNNDYSKDYDASRYRDPHSVGKNYKSSRPAPLYDEYEQPKYPPLPVDIPYSSTEKDSHEHHNSKEQNVNPRNIGNSHYGKSYPSAYNPSSYESDYTNSKSQSYYPVQNNSTYHSDHSSHEVGNEPIIYTKTFTKTYSAPYTDSPSAANYYEHSSESPYNAQSNKDSSSGSNYSPAEKVTSYTSSSKNSKPYSQPADEYSFSKPLGNKRKFRYYSQDYNSESSPTYVSERPKRVEGVVYRSRKTYPSLRSTRRHKNYLPYKVYNPESSPAVDYKVYENAPEKNFTEPPLKNAIKLKYRPLKKGSLREKFKDETYDDSYENDALANIPGEAGKDFPILKEIPQTYFSCDNRASGFYADVENRCQVRYNALLKNTKTNYSLKY